VSRVPIPPRRGGASLSVYRTCRGRARREDISLATPNRPVGLGPRVSGPKR
jgi:hypothetical protein